LSLWGRIFAALYDRMLADSELAGLADRRAMLLKQTRGTVLEVGAGTGLNLAHYPAAVRELVLVEPEEPMARRLQRRLRSTAVQARVVRAPAESIPVVDGGFDFAVCTLVLCTVRAPPQAFAELRRVLKPGGRLLFLEHVRADDPRLAGWQDHLDPLWVRIGHGCHCNRDTLQAIAAGGFSVDWVEHTEMPRAAPLTRPMIIGSASRSPSRGDPGRRSPSV
jgi:ubiquinone/menaquinone biosynthesis C-methylase UbiE